MARPKAEAGKTRKPWTISWFSKALWKRILLRGAIVLALLPVALTIIYSVVPPISTLMIGRYAQLLWVDRQYTSLEDISPNLVKSVITSEDSHFCEHGGVDWTALGDQIDILISEGEAARGASTLTMQTAKNLFLWNGRSYIRKGLEIPLAVLMDAMLTKRRILEIYLNVAEWGEGIFGAEAAAQAWFGVNAKDLSRRQAARLATALPNPHARNPAKPSPGHRNLAAKNLKRIQVAGPIFECALRS
ncbi:MAG: monofunctional biosynthetic peptidoglycan transglycosylase [Rhodobacteraceae bacterium]|nr:monofunctional biosynthetic peptidoglycan transglycosylase [Paracoccaceae bacterium]